MDYTDHIYAGTILLEPNRWTTRQPSVRVSDWIERFREAGFDGLELWENHALLASEEEREKLLEAALPVAIYNSYAGCGEEEAQRDASAEMARFLRAGGMKFNFGRDPAQHEAYARNARAWRAQVPPAFRMLCECHGGTTMEEPQVAAATLERMAPQRMEVIVHGFGGSDEGLRQRFALLGERITYVHVQVGVPSVGRVRLDHDPEAALARLDLLRELGFRGSYTIEFTLGVKQGGAAEDLEETFRNAVADMRFLRAHL